MSIDHDQAYKTDKGLGIVVSGDYGDETVEIYFADDASEIVMWTQEEWVREPSLVAKIAEVICCGILHGPESLREQFNKPKPVSGDEDYEPWGGWGALGGGELPYIVGVNADPPIRLRRFATEGEAARFIDTLEGAKDGRYYTDNMNEGEG